MRSFRLQALAKSSIKKYSGDFKIASMAADALDLDPFNLSEDDLSFLAVFHALGHSVHSLDPFFSAIANVYKDLGKVLPREHLFQATKRGLKRVFNPIDEVQRAYPLSFDQVRRILAAMDATTFDDVVLAFGCLFRLSGLSALTIGSTDASPGEISFADQTEATQSQSTLARARCTMVQLRGNYLRLVPPLASTRRTGFSA